MSAASSHASSERVLVDHQSPAGPTITHVRGIMMVNSVSNLREAGVYDEYAALMPAAHLNAIQQSLAMGWIPVATTVMHYEVCDQLALGSDVLESFGLRQAQRITDTFLGSAMRRARGFGADPFKQSVTQIDRLHERLYRGGGCTVLDVGPKDIVLELHGFPFAASRAFRVAWVAYVRAIAGAFAKVAYVKLVRPRQPHPHRAAIMSSYV